MVNGQPSPRVVLGMSLDDVVQVVREEACVQVGKQLFPVRDPSKPTGLENSEVRLVTGVCLDAVGHWSIISKP